MIWQIKAGDARAVLALEPAGSVQTVCTSPPFYGLRSYQTGPQIWGGALGCDHVWSISIDRSNPTKHADRESNGKHGYAPLETIPVTHGGYCMVLGCGAWRGELGSEPTVDLYVAHLVDVFRAVRRVLRPDGTLWVNLGDSFSHDSKWGGYSGGVPKQDSRVVGYNRNRQTTGLGDKQLLLVPARFALAMQGDGWILRQDIIWSKPNAMPSSVTDRPTTAHEHIFLFAQQARYYYDAAAIAEPSTGQEGTAANFARASKETLVPGQEHTQHRLTRVPTADSGTRNKRSVWTVPTIGYPGAHFATWPPALVEPMIRAGSRPGDLVCDPFCGSGTTGMVALRLGRAFLGIDLQPAYVALAERRIIADCPLFNAPQEATA